MCLLSKNPFKFLLVMATDLSLGSYLGQNVFKDRKAHDDEEMCFAVYLTQNHICFTNDLQLFLKIALFLIFIDKRFVQV